ncbi:MAG TPA: histidine kinase, partial [Deltaproteobacteria bacterium]|nr:histidine kinase [Deltaproteobacteria bacterium]
GRLNTDWYVVYVEAPEEAPDRIDSATQRVLHANIQKATELGAEVVRLQGDDIVATLLDFARSHAVAHILIGRTHASFWQHLRRGDFVQRMVREGDDFDLHICGLPERESAS